MYDRAVPKLWTDTIEEHRRAVQDAALDAVAALVREHGLAALTMSGIAAEAGIGRATLYKYFPDVEAVLIAWHERQVGRHLGQLAQVRDGAGSPAARLEAVLGRYAAIQHEHHGTELAALLHQGEHVARTHQQLQAFIAELIADGARAAEIRGDIAAGELAAYCLHALTAAGSAPSRAAVGRLLAVIMDGLRPPG
jgi:AcrR family transcriptional regulator